MIEAHRIIFPGELQASLEHLAFEESAEPDETKEIDSQLGLPP